MKEKATVGAVAGGINPETSLPTEAKHFLQLLGKDPAETCAAASSLARGQ